MPSHPTDFWRELFAAFDAPITRYDCGQFCAPHSLNGEPFCCNTQNLIPVASLQEWEYLQAATDLWKPYVAPNALSQAVADSAGEGLIPLQCKGARQCQRAYRSISCRAFPFFPYISRQGQLLGLTCYWKYQDICWVMSNLPLVNAQYVGQFIAAFERLFSAFPAEKADYLAESTRLRRSFGQRHLQIPLLHRDGNSYLVLPADGTLTHTPAVDFLRVSYYAFDPETP